MKRWFVFFVLAAAFFAAAACGGGDQAAPTSPPTGLPNGEPSIPPPPTGDGEMALTVEGGDCDDPVRPNTCSVAAGSSFTLVVEIVVAPPEGYIGVQSFILYGPDLVYNPAVAAEEIAWPDLEPATGLSSCSMAPCTDSTKPNGQAYHGGLAGLTSFVTSTYAGSFVELSFECSAGPSETVVELVALGLPPADTFGTGFSLPPETELDAPPQVAAKVSPLTINCV